jgi:hypothetical protein
MELMNARWVSEHKVDMRHSLVKRVPLGRLQETALYDGLRSAIARHVERFNH